MRSRLRDIPTAMRKEYSAAIVERILSLASFQKADVVMGFVPLATEPDLSLLYDKAIEMGKTLALPRCATEGAMAYYRVPSDWRAHIAMGPLHVGEPDQSCQTVEDTGKYGRSLVLVPALAYTPHRRRLGRGGGYYDRYCANDTTHTTHIGVCFSIQIESELPTEGHDLSVDVVVTEAALY